MRFAGCKGVCLRPYYAGTAGGWRQNRGQDIGTEIRDIAREGRVLIRKAVIEAADILIVIHRLFLVGKEIVRASKVRRGKKREQLCCYRIEVGDRDVISGKWRSDIPRTVRIRCSRGGVGDSTGEVSLQLRGGGNNGQLRRCVIDTRALPGEEQEGAILYDGSTDRGSILVLNKL